MSLKISEILYAIETRIKYSGMPKNYHCLGSIKVIEKSFLDRSRYMKAKSMVSALGTLSGREPF